MRKAQIKIGATYYAKVSNTVQQVTIKRVSPYGGWEGVNVKTGRAVRIKSAARLRSEVTR